MNPAYIPPEEKHGAFWRKSAQYTLTAKLQETPNLNKAKNGILFIGDGMSQATIMAARTFYGQMERGLGEETTYCIDAQVADSACTATSYLTGVKTKYGVIGLDGNVTRGSCFPQLHEPNWSHSIGQCALDHGLDVGVVTTTRVTHASPAGLYAHSSERLWESDANMPDECLSLGCKDIAYQLMMENPGKQFKVIMGGGRKEFLPNTTLSSSSSGSRLDGVDLTEAWHAHKLQLNASHLYVTDRLELMKAQNQPTLEEMVEVAIKMLSRSPKGYFLFVEGGRIDHAHHDSLAHLALDETVEYSKAIKKAKSLTNEEDTLIVVSADHAHTMTVSGYPSRGNDILSTVDTAKGMDGLPYTTISYANGKASSIVAGGRVDLSRATTTTYSYLIIFKGILIYCIFYIPGDLGYSYPSLVPIDSETHGGEDVAVYAIGPYQHLFTASYEQNVLPHLMAYAMCLGEDKHKNCNSNNYRVWKSSAGSIRPIKHIY
ncbi:Alkaline phosphatase, partial [Operophtera brumata]